MSYAFLSLPRPRSKHAYHYWVPSYIFDSNLSKNASKEEQSRRMRSYRVLEADICRMTTCLAFPGDDYGVTHFRYGPSPIVINDVQFICMFVFTDASIPYSSVDLATIFGTIIRSSRTNNNGNFYNRSKY